jgi:F-type H+-transporting ATPase subunit epsilon
MFVKVLTPDKEIFKGDATQVKLPGTDGGMEILKDHAPLISTLGKGTLSVNGTQGNKNFIVDGGVVEVLNNNITILVETVLEN